MDKILILGGGPSVLPFIKDRNCFTEYDLVIGCNKIFRKVDVDVDVVVALDGGIIWGECKDELEEKGITFWGSGSGVGPGSKCMVFEPITHTEDERYKEHYLELLQRRLYCYAFTGEAALHLAIAANPKHIDFSGFDGKQGDHMPEYYRPRGRNLKWISNGELNHLYKRQLDNFNGTFKHHGDTTLPVFREGRSITTGDLETAAEEYGKLVGEKWEVVEGDIQKEEAEGE